MKAQTPSQSPDQKNKLIVFSCSGASDLGEITDRLARKLRDKGNYAMKCLAMVAARDNALIEQLQKSTFLVLDGCGVDCGKKIMEEAWLSDYQYLRLSDLGYEKARTPVTEDLIDELFQRIISNDKTELITHNRIPAATCNNNNCSPLN
jgi:uncharacterized metal-binding protein